MPAGAGLQFGNALCFTRSNRKCVGVGPVFVYPKRKPGKWTHGLQPAAPLPHSISLGPTKALLRAECVACVLHALRLAEASGFGLSRPSLPV